WVDRLPPRTRPPDACAMPFVERRLDSGLTQPSKAGPHALHQGLSVGARLASPLCEPHPYTCPVPAQAIKAARGVRDILPAERVVWWRVEAAAAAAARSFGYAEIETPVIEPVGLI